MRVEFYKLDQRVPDPIYGSSHANCFDLCFFPTATIEGYNKEGWRFQRLTMSDGLRIDPGDRILIPTGLVARIVAPDVQHQHTLSLRLYARSGLSFKKGLTLANGVGIVDVDYNEQIYAMLTNIGAITQLIRVGERICQAEILDRNASKVCMVTERPEPLENSNRTGGFGSTGS